MLEKYTFSNDDETNTFFRSNPNAYLIKIIIAEGKQHLVITRDTRIMGREHMQPGRQKPRPTQR